MKKRPMVYCMALAMACALSACGGSDSAPQTQAAQTEAVATEAEKPSFEHDVTAAETTAAETTATAETTTVAETASESSLYPEDYTWLIGKVYLEDDGNRYLSFEKDAIILNEGSVRGDSEFYCTDFKFDGDCIWTYTAGGTAACWTYGAVSDLDMFEMETIGGEYFDFYPCESHDESHGHDSVLHHAEEHAGDEEYMIPDSDKVALSESDLVELSVVQLRIARNEIYARHGRIFASEDLKEHFEGCSWYSGTIPGDSFDESVLSSVEKSNLTVIAAYEEKLGAGSGVDVAAQLGKAADAAYGSEDGDILSIAFLNEDMFELNINGESNFEFSLRDAEISGNVIRFESRKSSYFCYDYSANEFFFEYEDGRRKYYR